MYKEKESSPRQCVSGKGNSGPCVTQNRDSPRSLYRLRQPEKIKRKTCYHKYIVSVLKQTIGKPLPTNAGRVFYARAALIAFRYYFKLFYGMNIGNSVQIRFGLERQNPFIERTTQAIEKRSECVNTCWALLNCAPKKHFVDGLLPTHWDKGTSLAALFAAMYARSVLTPVYITRGMASAYSMYCALSDIACVVPSEETSMCCKHGCILSRVHTLLSASPLSSDPYPLLAISALLNRPNTQHLFDALANAQKLPSSTHLFEKSIARLPKTWDQKTTLSSGILCSNQ
ncbi:ORF43-like protein [Bufonid herpesvirus 1]|uniref:ORF43-like protein n=1 Tax=Bufonid herpesvirus 1 TaxID=2282206 RepID=UPI000EB73228|nr:ORF43-like protein [Bufonid herpesvirus 1]AXF48607.1 ORF43-like protein [Bufonid herpesvirus 1]